MQECYAWGRGRDPVYGHFAWLAFYLGAGPQHSFDSQKGFMTPKMFKNHSSGIWFWPIVINHWAKNILSVHMFLESTGSYSNKGNRRNLCLLEFRNLNMGKLVSGCTDRIMPSDRWCDGWLRCRCGYISEKRRGGNAEKLVKYLPAA